MVKAVTVRDVPDEVVSELAVRAAASGRSLQEFLRGHLVDLVSRPDIEVWLTHVHERKATTGGWLGVEEILDAKDADRR